MTSATAPGKLPAAVDATHQAGGGLSGQERNIKKFEPGVLAHLNNIYQAQTKDQTWKPEQVADWLRNVQGDDDAELAKDFAPAQSETGWDKTSFLTYLSSPTANVIAPPKPQDMSWPLSSYFVSSSHNTYLTGNQLSSDSSADAYKNVLLRGCRCIEIDVWDGSDSETSEEGDDTSSSSSSSSSDDDEAKYQKRKERVKKVKSKVPSSFLSKLSLGKKLDKYAEKKKPSSSSEESGAKTGTTEGEEEPVVAGKDTRDAGSVGAAANAAGEVLKKIPSIKEPRVLHGFTLTKDITFREVCDAVREYGFVASDLPLIVSLEVHCSPEQQEAMVHIMEQTWQGLLLPTPKEDAQSLPAPGDLRGKILVKVKYAPPNQPVGGDVTPPSEPDEAAAAAAASAAAAGKKPPANKASKIIQALSRLGIYTRGVSFKSLTQPEAAMPTHIFSLSEGGVMEVHEKQRKALFDHNRHFLMRAYPSGLRIRSSNLDPAVFWRKGIQIVALNWQNWDEGMMLNEGMFAGTGGYVLKPVGYRGNKIQSSPQPPTDASTTQADAVVHYNMDLRITVLAAQNLPLPPGDKKPDSFRPYIKVEVHVEEPGERHGSDPVPDDGKEKEGEYKAKTKSLKGINPDWAVVSPNGQTLDLGGGAPIPGVVPELSFVRFLVRDDELGRDSLAAWACVRLDRLREGYRFVHLLDAKGMETDAIVLVRVEKRLWV